MMTRIRNRLAELPGEIKLGTVAGIVFVVIVGAAVFCSYSVVQLRHAASSAQQAAQATHELLLNGKSASARSAKAAAASAKAGEAIIAHVEGQLDSILSRSDSNRELICSIATAAGVSTPTIRADCPLAGARIP